MKLILLFGLFLITSLKANAHEYFFGFAELAYNNTEENLQGTLMLSTHDLEEWFQSKKIPVKEMEDHVGDEKLLQQMASALFDNFKVKSNGSAIKFEIIGYEVLPTGMTNFYFHSTKVPKPKKLEIIFDLMMSELPAQQNKITYMDNEKSYTAVFTLTKKQSSIIIE